MHAHTLLLFSSSSAWHALVTCHHCVIHAARDTRHPLKDVKRELLIDIKMMAET